MNSKVALATQSTPEKNEYMSETNSNSLSNKPEIIWVSCGSGCLKIVQIALLCKYLKNNN